MGSTATGLRLWKEKHGLNKKYSNKVKKIEKFDAAKKREKSLQQLKKTDVKSDLGLVPNYFSSYILDSPCTLIMYSEVLRKFNLEKKSGVN